VGVELVHADLEKDVVDLLMPRMHGQKLLVHLHGLEGLTIQGVGVAEHNLGVHGVGAERIAIVQLDQGIDGLRVVLVLHGHAGVLEKLLGRVLGRGQEIIVDGPAAVQKEDQGKKDQFGAHGKTRFVVKDAPGRCLHGRARQRTRAAACPRGHPLLGTMGQPPF
jgi:hypothetical protein